jgi:hypothetical protein
MAVVRTSQQFRVPSHVLSRSVGDDTVLLDLRREEYFSLDAVGTRVWSLLVEGESLRAIVDRMSETSGTDPAVVADDVDALIADLVASGVLVTT